MKDGKPLSWRHFIYGLSILGRSTARETMRSATAFGAAFMGEADARKWVNEQELAAGLVWETIEPVN